MRKRDEFLQAAIIAAMLGILTALGHAVAAKPPQAPTPPQAPPCCEDVAKPEPKKVCALCDCGCNEGLTCACQATGDESAKKVVKKPAPPHAKYCPCSSQCTCGCNEGRFCSCGSPRRVEVSPTTAPHCEGGVCYFPTATPAYAPQGFGRAVQSVCGPGGCGVASQPTYGYAGSGGCANGSCGTSSASRGRRR